MQKKKSQVVGFLLTLLLGPFGLFYSSPPAALGLIILATTFLFTEQPMALFAAWPVSILVGIWTVARHRGSTPSITNPKTDNSQVVSSRDNEILQDSTPPVANPETGNSQVVSVHGDRISRHPVGQITKIEGQRLGIIDLGTDLSSELRAQIDTNILTHGEPFKSGGVLGPACLPVIGTGSAVVSSLFASHIFLATANPNALMQIGSGVGSAVIGSGGKILLHAPFIQASSAIIPVVAPVMFFMTVSSMMMSARFDQIQVSLDQLATTVAQLLRREIVGDYGILLSAMERLRDISAEFEECRRFTDEMRMRMALVEKDVNILHHKYNILANPENRVDSILAANLAIPDINLFTLSSLADIQVDRLRLKLALQDNPDDACRSFSMLNSKIDRYEASFKCLLENDSVKEYEKELNDSLDGMNWWKRHISEKKIAKQKEAEVEALDDISERRLDTLLNLSRWSEDLALGKDAGHEQSVVYYRANDGKGELKAYYTSDWQLQEYSK